MRTGSNIYMYIRTRSDGDNTGLSVAEWAYIGQLEWLLRIYLQLGLPSWAALKAAEADRTQAKFEFQLTPLISIPYRQSEA